MIVRLELLTEQLKQQAQDLGFVLAGVAAAAAPGRIAKFHQWLEAGYAGEMRYLENRREAYSHPSSVLDGCRSLLMLGLPYATEPQVRAPDAIDVTEMPSGSGRVARYACGGEDYHDVIHLRLKRLKAWLLEQQPTAQVRGVVDTAPLLEREFAELSGIGWVGKNTLLLNRQWGSYFFLAAILTDLELTLDEPQEANFCGTCTACLDHCPTGAFPEPYVLDASRCISYLTIEHRSDVDSDLAEKLDGWVFGCDVCQEVCPWNRKAAVSEEEVFRPEPTLQDLDLMQVLQMDDEEFRRAFRATPLWRSKRRGILRNAILLSGNQRMQPAIPALEKLLDDPEPLIRSAAAWALSRIAQSPER